MRWSRSAGPSRATRSSSAPMRWRGSSLTHDGRNSKRRRQGENRMTSGLKTLAGTKKPKFGHFIVEFATPGIGHILKSAGCDFVLFDLEHSGFGFETVKSAIRYFEAADLPVIVRVPSKEYHHIARAMDMGAEGLMLPMVGNVDEARHILKSMKYTPDGGRGVALQVSHDRYRPGPVVDKFVAANRRSTFFCQIETARALRTPTPLRRCRESTVCGWVISTFQFRLACQESSTRRRSPTRSLASLRLR